MSLCRLGIELLGNQAPEVQEFVIAVCCTRIFQDLMRNRIPLIATAGGVRNESSEEIKEALSGNDQLKI